MMRWKQRALLAERRVEAAERAIGHYKQQIRQANKHNFDLAEVGWNLRVRAEKAEAALAKAREPNL